MTSRYADYIQMGHDYRVHIRGEDLPCPHCGYTPSEAPDNPNHGLPSLPDIDGMTVTTIDSVSTGQLRCASCGGIYTVQGYVDVILKKDPSLAVAVPWTWLEPLDWTPNEGRLR
jgi:hypothetical protein